MNRLNDIKVTMQSTEKASETLIQVTNQLLPQKIKFENPKKTFILLFAKRAQAIFSGMNSAYKNSSIYCYAILARSLIETYFFIKALEAGVIDHTDILLHDNNERKRIANGMLRNKEKINITNYIPELEALTKNQVNSIQFEDLSQKLNLNALYQGFYRVISNRFCHASAQSVDNFLEDTDDDEDTLSKIIILHSNLIMIDIVKITAKNTYKSLALQSTIRNLSTTIHNLADGAE